MRNETLGVPMKCLLLISLAVLGTAFGAHAADFLVQEEAASATGSSFNGYIQVVGGISKENESGLDWDYIANVPMDQGTAFGVALGMETPVDGVSVEIDALRSGATYAGFPNYLNATTVMGNVDYSAILNDSLSFYGGLGAGVVRLNYDNGDNISPDSNGNGLGWQAFAGAELAVADHLSLTLEVRHQQAFETIEVTPDVGSAYDIEYARTVMLAGVLVSF